MNLEPLIAGPGKKKAYKAIFILAVIFFFFIDFFIERHHPHFAWDTMPGFNALFGLVGSSIIIVFSKVVVQWFISRKEDHYDK